MSIQCRYIVDTMSLEKHYNVGLYSLRNQYKIIMKSFEQRSNLVSIEICRNLNIDKNYYILTCTLCVLTLFECSWFIWALLFLYSKDRFCIDDLFTYLVRVRWVEMRESAYPFLDNSCSFVTDGGIDNSTYVIQDLQRFDRHIRNVTIFDLGFCLNLS